MFAAFTRDLLRPEMSNTLDALLRQSPQRDPVDDFVPSCGAFHRRDRGVRGTVDMFRLMMNVKQFTQSEVQVKLVNGYIVVHAAHKEQADVHGFVSREFVRRYEIPDCVDPPTIRVVFQKNNVLLIKAPKKVQNPKTDDEKIIPVEDQKPFDVDSLGSTSFDVSDVPRSSVGTATNQ